MSKKILVILVCLFLLLGMLQAVAAPLGDSLGHRNDDTLKVWGKLITGLSLDSNEYSLKIGESHGIIVSAAFKDRAPIDVTSYCSFESSDPSVAVVESDGTVKGVSAGTAVISVNLLGEKEEIDVTVLNDHSGLFLDSNSYSLKIGEKHYTVVTAKLPDDTTVNVTSDASYTSSDEKVASVDDMGVVTAVGKGMAVISASYNGFAVNAEVTVAAGSKGDKMWTLVWDDEFKDDKVDTSKWTLENKGDGFGNNEAQYYRPENAVVKGGKLIIQAKKEDYGGRNYTSAKLFTRGKGDWKYGRFEAKIKLPVGQGFWPAFWMMPTDSEYGGWAASGEMDIMEARGRIPDVVGGTLHYGGAWPDNKYTGKEYQFPDGQAINDFHTYSMEWEPGEIRWYVDGKLYQTQNNWNTIGVSGEEKYAFPAPFDQEFYLILNLAVGGNFDGGRLPEDSMFPAEMEVDYVRVYTLTGRPYRTPVEPDLNVQPLPEGAKQADSTGNLVSDMNFEQGIKDNAEGVDADFGDGWNFVHNAQFGGTADVSVETINGTNYAKINVADKGSQPYSLQLEQLTTLGKGRWYKYSFDAKADRNRTLNTKLGGGPTAGWAAYSDSYTVNLTTEFQHFEREFQMTRDTDILTRIEFNCATDTGPVWIGNARLEEAEPPEVDYNASKEPLPVSGNLIYNGAFDKYTIDRMACWNVTKTGVEAVVSVPESTRELTASITYGGEEAAAITVDQRGLQLLSGNSYKLMFKARAKAGRTIKVKVSSKDGSVSYLPEQQIALSTAMQNFEFPFSMSTATDLEAQLLFMLGGNDSDVYIDDVSLVRTSMDYSNVDLYPMRNGDFSNGVDEWDSWAGEGGNASIASEDGECRITVNSAGSQPWSIQLYQDGLNLVKDVEYLVAFDVYSTAARNMEISLENKDYYRYFTKTIAVGETTTHFEYTFKMPKSDLITFKYLMGKTDDVVGALGTHDIYIDNIVCEVKEAKFITSVVRNGQFNSGFEPWKAWTGDGGIADISTVNGEMKIAVSNIGPNSWSVQAFQEELTFENGQKYRVSFKARADIPRKININIGKALTADPWFTPYMPMQTADLANDMQEYVYEFIMSEPTYTNAKIVFEAGNVPGGNAATNIYIDDIAVNKLPSPVSKVAAPSFDPAGRSFDTVQTVTISCATEGAIIRYTTDGSIPNADSTVYSGPFTISATATVKAYATKSGMTDSEVSAAMYTQAHGLLNGTFDTNTDHWNIYNADGSNAAISVDNGRLKVDFPDYDGWFIFSTQVYQGNIKLEANKTYIFSFDISSTLEKPVVVSIEKGSDYNVKYLPANEINLTTTPQTLVYEFTTGTDTELDAKVVFQLGSKNVPGESFISHSIYIDNITLRDK